MSLQRILGARLHTGRRRYYVQGGIGIARRKSAEPYLYEQTRRFREFEVSLACGHSFRVPFAARPRVGARMKCRVCADAKVPQPGTDTGGEGTRHEE